MNYFFIGEDFSVQFTAGVDLTGGSAVVKYRRAGVSVAQSKNATITDLEAGVFKYDFSDTEITVEGRYLFWGVATESDGTKSISEPIVIFFKKEGTETA